jgi:hypothetical protein
MVLRGVFLFDVADMRWLFEVRGPCHGESSRVASSLDRASAQK